MNRVDGRSPTEQVREPVEPVADRHTEPPYLGDVLARLEATNRWP